MKRTVVLAATFLLVLMVNSAFGQNAKDHSAKEGDLKYKEMTNSEKRQFIEEKSNELLGLFRRVAGDELSSKSVDQILLFVDHYVKRIDKEKNASKSCNLGDNLTDVLKRGSSVAPTINKEFTNKELPSQIGLYTAMIESEFCPCIQSPTGSLGMFQFTSAVAKLYGIKTITGATSENPDERCVPEKASLAASNFYGDLLNKEFGKNSIGFTLSLAAYNAGTGATKKNVKYVQSETKKEDVSFWLMSDVILEKYKDKSDSEEESPVTKQFLYENYRYVPKFFAAAIIGENPEVFGIEMKPLSQYK